MTLLRSESSYPAVERLSELAEQRSKLSGQPMQPALNINRLLEGCKVECISSKNFQPCIVDCEDKKLLYHTVVSSEQAFLDIGVSQDELADWRQRLHQLAEDEQFRLFGVGSVSNVLEKSGF